MVPHETLALAGGDEQIRDPAVVSYRIVFQHDQLRRSP
jgi:hypothetical protein